MLAPTLSSNEIRQSGLSQSHRAQLPGSWKKVKRICWRPAPSTSVAAVGTAEWGIAGAWEGTWGATSLMSQTRSWQTTPIRPWKMLVPCLPQIIHERRSPLHSRCVWCCQQTIWYGLVYLRIIKGSWLILDFVKTACVALGLFLRQEMDLRNIVVEWYHIIIASTIILSIVWRTVVRYCSVKWQQSTKYYICLEYWHKMRTLHTMTCQDTNTAQMDYLCNLAGYIVPSNSASVSLRLSSCRHMHT